MVGPADYRELVRHNGGAKAFMISKLRAMFCISREMCIYSYPTPPVTVWTACAAPSETEPRSSP